MPGPTTLLLLGSRGFVGRHLRALAEAADLRVVGTSTRPAGAELLCDLRDPASVAEAVSSSNPDLIVNMAGSASVAGSWKHPEETMAVNAGGVRHLLEAVAAEAPEAHVLCVSSGEVYGEVAEDELPLTEEHRLDPASPYGESKVAMEELCSRYASSRGLRTGIIRAFNQIGPGQSPQFATSAFARQIAAAELDGASELELRVGNLSAARDFTDVRDAALAFLAASQRNLTDTFNMCSGEATRIENLVELMRGATVLDLAVRPDPELVRPVDTPVIFGSAAKLRAATGWAPEIPTERSIGDLLDWWRAELARERVAR